jgi:PqqA peptide cyclase
MRRTRVSITETSIPCFERGVRLHHDWARQRIVLLTPERVIVPDTPALDILSRCDNGRSVADIADALAPHYGADRATVLSDTIKMLQGLADKRVLCSDGASSSGARKLSRGTEPLSLADGPTLPLAVLAEVTHRCPLQCPYCSNPLGLERASAELSTRQWMKAIDEIAGMGVLQIHFSGGEPLARKDIADLVRHACEASLYTNLITSGVTLDRGKMALLAEAGLDHVQISFQGADAVLADHFAGHSGAFDRKRAAAELVKEFGLPLTVNAVVHRQNMRHIPEFIELAVTLGAARIEIAHVQYLGWALKNRAALMPTRAQFSEATDLVEAARERLKGILVIDYVIPDYYAVRPKACMDGWGRKFMNITPSGKVLPCHAAETITGLSFASVQDQPLATIWRESSAMRKYRGSGWMEEPCRNCAFRDVDFGGCRCQAFALTGDGANTDPTCGKSARNVEIAALAEAEAAADMRSFSYRRFPSLPD